MASLFSIFAEITSPIMKGDNTMFNRLRKERQELIMSWESMLQFYQQVQALTDPKLKEMGMKVFQQRKEELTRANAMFILKRSFMPKWLQRIVFQEKE